MAAESGFSVGARSQAGLPDIFEPMWKRAYRNLLVSVSMRKSVID